MINVYSILFYLIFICVQNSHEKTTKKYEYINLLSAKDYSDKLPILKKKYNIKDSGAQNEKKNNYVFSFYGSTGYDKRKVLEHLFNIPCEKRNFINLGFHQKLDLWYGYDKNNNLNIVLDIDLLENKEFLDNNQTIYNYEKLVDLIVESTNSIIIPLSLDDIYIEKSYQKENGKKGESEQVSQRGSEKQKDFSNLYLPKKIENFLNQLNEKGKNMHIYFVLIGESNKKMELNKLYNNFMIELKRNFNNLHNIYLMKQNKLNLSLLQKNNVNKCKLLINDMENALKQMNIFKNFSPFNQNCVYNIYVIEEAYNKTLNYFDDVYYGYEKIINMGNIIEDYGILFNNLIKNALFFFHILTLEQTGTTFKDTVLEKLRTRFVSLIRKQIVKQLLLLEKKIIKDGKEIVLNKQYVRRVKDLIGKGYKLENLKKSLIKKFNEEINKLVIYDYLKQDDEKKIKKKKKKKKKTKNYNIKML
ncbi:conserved Plasmodium protein, unknown function [Plasmodium malariae]|uniref:Uncharacterized protein n=1 Tax=Plasmodium malariae TaxID=5858 RepID=A0A1C3KZK3_PLAMA|nr:conserved Plasmodium protein, unknown function [Plasmodium malariae]